MADVPEAYRITGPQMRKCEFCGGDNPVKAYCCLHCYKVLHPKYHLPWYRKHICLTTPMMIVLFCFVAVVVFTFKRWVENAEAQVDTSISRPLKTN